jgi:hypothetical protein
MCFIMKRKKKARRIIIYLMKMKMILDLILISLMQYPNLINNKLKCILIKKCYYMLKRKKIIKYTLNLMHML